jgi:predicted lactoylglutathione lyase
MRAMEQRVSVITLGVRDLEGARAFYEALGWNTQAQPGADSVFVDPDGHPWEVAHNPHWTLHDDGSVELSA